MNMTSLECKNILVKYMEDYLQGKIGRLEYYESSEKLYSKHGDLLKRYCSDFNELFMERIFDECLYYSDEPGLSEAAKEQLFREDILETYNLLSKL